MKKRDWLIILIGAGIFAFFLNRLFPENQINVSIISPIADKISGNKNVNSNESKALAQIVNKNIGDAPGTYGIVIKNLRTGEYYAQNENRIFQPASLYKLWVAAEAYDQINKGLITKDEILSRDIEELNRIFDIDPENAESTDGTITKTVKEAIEQMITISHNYSALLLSVKLGNSNIANYIKRIGLTSSKMGSPPLTTPSDIAKFYETLYNGEIINPASSAELIEVLKRQELNDRIPKYLPQNVEVAHKTGELGAFKHDAGIIFAKDSILFVAMSETDSQVTAAENIAKLSKDVYDYFEKN